ncbi:MAG: hypothetical protein WCG32_01470 [Actinomycetes bacterium]
MPYGKHTTTKAVSSNLCTNCPIALPPIFVPDRSAIAGAGATKLGQPKTNFQNATGLALKLPMPKPNDFSLPLAKTLLGKRASAAVHT